MKRSQSAKCFVTTFICFTFCLSQWMPAYFVSPSICCVPTHTFRFIYQFFVSFCLFNFHFIVNPSLHLFSRCPSGKFLMVILLSSRQLTFTSIFALSICKYLADAFTCKSRRLSVCLPICVPVHRAFCLSIH